MTSSAVARVHAGVPAGGQFAATSHSEPSLTLVPEQSVDWADNRDAFTPDQVATVESWQHELASAGISGKMANAEFDSGQFRADLTTPDGRTFGFSGGVHGVDVWRDGVDVDWNHEGVSDIFHAWTGDAPNSRDLAVVFGEARRRAVIADDFAAWSTVHSNEQVAFGLPAISEAGSAEMEIRFSDGRDYRVVVPRGADQATVFDSNDDELSDRQAAAILADAAEAAGESPDGATVVHSLTRSLEGSAGGTW